MCPCSSPTVAPGNFRPRETLVGNSLGYYGTNGRGERMGRAASGRRQAWKMNEHIEHRPGRQRLPLPPPTGTWIGHTMRGRGPSQWKSQTCQRALRNPNPNSRTFLCESPNHEVPNRNFLLQDTAGLLRDIGGLGAIAIGRRVRPARDVVMAVLKGK